MNRWFLLFLVIMCWIFIGLTITSQRRQRYQYDTIQADKVDRIVSMAPNLTEILFALGLEDKIIGVTMDSDYPVKAKEKTKVGTFWQPNIEAVIAAKPDLVVTLGFSQQINLANRLERIGYKCLTLNIEKANELFEAIKVIGSQTGKFKEANELVSDIKVKLDNLQTTVETLDKVKVLWVVQREPLRVAGRDTFINEMIELAGGKNAMRPTLHKYPPIGAEQVIASGADVIIEMSMGQEDIAGQRNSAIQYWTKFKNVPAVINKRIYVVKSDYVARLGPRFYEGVETIARNLRPELF